MNVLSLFDGMSCGQIALNKLGIGVNNYYAAEIDKYAIEITQKNYPDTIQLGDVTKWEDWDIDWSSIDVVSGGFPCQAWSIAGRQQGDRDPRGMLFWTMLDIIKKVRESNPDAYFLMENVKMKKEFEEYITHHTEAALGTVYKHLINSNTVSAQNRERYYWTNIPNIVQPENKGLVISDVLVEDYTQDVVVKDIPNYHLMRKTPNYWQFDSSGRGFSSQQDRVRRFDVPSNTLSAGHSSIPQIWVDFDTKFRRLTPTECERLQTVPDGYTQGVAKGQRYKMLGNGWTVDVIAHIYKFLEWN